MKKFVYSFNEGSKDMKDLLGGKGANLAEMTKIGLPVPFGFTVTTEACNRYYEEGRVIADDIIKDIFEKLIKEYTEKQWGRECKELPAFIIKRLPCRFVYDNNYFNDRYQGIPIGGYTAMVEKNSTSGM